MKKSKLHLQLVLMFIVTMAVLVVFSQGGRYFGKSYYETNSFDSESESFTSELSRYVLNPLTEEDLKEVLIVNDDEVEHYRTYYGSLAEQIQNIKDQYAGDLDAAQDADVKQALEQERDAKIEDIKKNFEDDEYVKSKIVTMKQKVVKEVLEEQNRNKKEFLNGYKNYAYQFQNEKTGESFSKGDVSKSSVYKDKFEAGDLPVVTHHINLYEYEHIGYLDKTYTIEKDLADYSGMFTIPKSLLAKTDYGENSLVFEITKYIYYLILLLGILSFVLLMSKLEPSKKPFLIDSQLRQFMERLPIDVAIAVTVLVAYIAMLFIESIIGSMQLLPYLFLDSHVNIFGDILVLFIGYGLFIVSVYFVVWVWERIRLQADLDKLWQETFLSKLVNASIAMFENRSMGLQSLILLLVVYLGGFGLAVVTLSASGEAFLLYVMLFVLFFMPTLFIFMRRIGYLNRIMRHTEDMAYGRLTNDLKVKGKSPLAKHAENLNGLREGVRTSIQEQAKSERLKTELITNVSHDLRTPLTSIITYTDLLKNPDISEEERKKYIAILDAKSSRLKTLIEDLFEVSKMASGNIEISKQRIDLAQLLKQAVGEHEEDYAAAHLDLRVNISEQPIFAYVDGQKWWRVIDNLIVNARKYSLEGTRVYVNLKMNAGNAELTVKNVAKYELHEDASELIERFKRADTSRHTEGSGLGLAISQSIVDLHGGSMDVAVDGDLFKVTVTVRADK
ncbi:HAMP domain-containing histidine kinase [Solibacillus sp. FSL R7-0682]|uniref:HAMP domain-containing sensor histidine kinase n=1 Tax=Solibacillus sp. FSL R7-0682 TaxID=2921690 RepID=UPI0030F6E8C9